MFHNRVLRFYTFNFSEFQVLNLQDGNDSFVL